MSDIKQRKIGLDILRILSMSGIVGLHLIGQGGLINNLSMSNYRTYIVMILYVICYLSVDTFGIMSGYLSWKKERINYKRILELITITLFYCITITLLCILFNLKSLGIKEIIISLFPMIIGRYWYITSYILVFFLMPYLNFFIKEIPKFEYKKMLIVLFILLSIIPNIFGSTDFFMINNGYSPFWLIYCYLIGGYIGKYIDVKTISSKHYVVLALNLIASYSINIIIKLTCILFIGKTIKQSWFINYISPFIIVSSIIMVIIFSKVKVKNEFLKKIIIFLSTTSFGVYIIHSHYLIYDYIIKNILLFCIDYNIILIILIFLGMLCIIYLTCSIIEFLRMKIFTILKIEKLIAKIGNAINNKL